MALRVALLALLGAASAAVIDRRQLLNGTSYDYIVTGGGTAGATLAARIAEDPSVTVALIEAGDATLKDNLLVYIPGADVIGVGAVRPRGRGSAADVAQSPADTVTYDWNFQTAPQAGAGGRQLHYARGRGIGGSSARNFSASTSPIRGADFQ